ncbi:Outer membrane protein assembly factor BamB, contains PQQ-like beta-propeller repeat [Micromonospora inositola]|uniref:Outer membrane protein assembly factor BamB, contains PQQ-like beta-propeller repeat n=2 Tax=Micromonospora inositola TaxID=47865 RepID=A0A1C5JNP2_9ACTN|nr:Outer membrane protein assembly factor BamB, contains PQQ-like beta-propeller repeat [Micromonospora inositola]
MAHPDRQEQRSPARCAEHWWLVGSLLVACVGGCLAWPGSRFGALLGTDWLDAVEQGFEGQMPWVAFGPLVFTLFVGLLTLRRRGRNPRRRGSVLGLLVVAALLTSGTGCSATSDSRSGDGPATVAAFDVETGRPVWVAELEAANGASTPAFGADLVLVQTGRSYESPAGRLVALDPRSGRQLWYVATEGGTCGGADALGDPPMIADGVVVVPAPDGYIQGINARDGSERWRTRVAGAPAAIADGVVLVGTQTAYAGLDLATGAQRWTQSVPEAAWGDWRPGGRAFVLGAGSTFVVELATAGGFSVAALDAGSGRELWRDAVGSVDSTARRYFTDGVDTLAALQGGPMDSPHGQATRLVGRDLRSGKPLWATEDLPPNEDDLPQTGIAADGGRVFYASASGRLVALDARSGAERWTASYRTGKDLFVPRLMVGEDAVVVRQGTQLSVFEAATGAQRWSTRLDSSADPETTAATGKGLVLVPRSSQPCMPPVAGGMGPA